MRCLIVDDSQGFLAAARRLLQRQGITVTGVASTGEEALRQAEKLRPDVVLLPHARRRLPVDDPVRLGALARRYAPARSVVLDDGGTLAASRTIGPDGRLT